MENYFAYASNLSTRQMARRCSSYRVVSRAVLGGYRLAFPRRSRQWRGGVAGIVADAQAEVEGVVYEVSDKDLERLDSFEGVPVSSYHRVRVVVTTPEGLPIEAWAYVANAEDGVHYPPTREYLSTMLEGAKEHQLSMRTISYLEGLRREAGSQ